jgi:guanosine-3',5'-bis(diphosphate) 3'-pyrophosphohydrolase
LKIVQSSQAKSKIRQWFKREKREENVARGRELIEKEIVKQKLEPHLLMTPAAMQDVLQKFNFSKEEDMYAAVGYGGLSAVQVVTRLLDKFRRDHAGQPLDKVSLELRDRGKTSYNGVRVRGVDNLLIRFARCCNPVPGDEIIGFITRGRGVSVHRTDCPNVEALTRDENRVIEVEWAGSGDSSYLVDLDILALDRHGLINEVMNAVAETKTDITAVSGRVDAKKIAHISLTVRIRNLDHLRSVVERLKRIKDVHAVRRLVQ